MSKVTIGIDIGGTNTVIGVCDEGQTIIYKRSIPTWETRSMDRFYDELAAAVRYILNEAKVPLSDVHCIGMGVPGIVDPLAGVAVRSANLGWRHAPLASEVSRRLDVPVRIDNDVRLYTLGEAVAGAGKIYRNIICLTLGTGIASGLIVDGKIIRGGGMCAGEFGHMPVKGESAPCNCGKQGCVETIVSATGIVRLAKEHVAAGKQTSLRDLGREISAYDVFLACQDNDPVAQYIFHFVGTTLGEQLVPALYLLNPEVVIIGGGVAQAGEYILAPLRTALAAHYHFVDQLPHVCVGQLGDEAGLIGAAYFAADDTNDI